MLQNHPKKKKKRNPKPSIHDRRVLRRPPMASGLKSVRWVVFFLGVSNVGVLFFGGFLVVSVFSGCGDAKKLPFMAVAAVAAVRVMAMVGAGVAQKATATTIVAELQQQPLEGSVVDEVVRHERRGFTGSDILRWRSFYATHDTAWKAHYREIFDHGIREALCCMGRVKYLSVLEEDEVYSVARLLGDLVAYRASGTGHLELLAGLALLQRHSQCPDSHSELMEAPEAQLQEAAAYHQFAEAAYTGPLLDFGRNPVLFPCAWLHRQGFLTPWTRNRRPVLEGDNWWRGHAAAFLKYTNVPPEALRCGRVSQLYRRYPNLHVYSYGTLPCVDPVVAEACSNFVTSIIYNDEFSARLSISSILRLRAAAIKALSDESSTDSALISKLARRILQVNRHQVSSGADHTNPSLPFQPGVGSLEDGGHMYRRQHFNYTVKGGAFLCAHAVSCMLNMPAHHSCSHLVDEGHEIQIKDLSDESRSSSAYTVGGCLQTGHNPLFREGNSLIDDLNPEITRVGFDEYTPQSGATSSFSVSEALKHSHDAVNPSIQSYFESCSNVTDLVHQVIDDDTLSSNKVFLEDPPEMYLPGLIIHIVPEQRSILPIWKSWITHDRKGEYRAFLANRESFKDIIVSPYMFLDHLPWRVHHAMLRVLETRRAQVEMEAVSPIIEVVKCVCNPAVRYVGYAKNLKKNFEKLDKMAKDLYDRRADIQLLVRNTAGAGKIPSSRCETWLKDVEDIEKQMVEMKEKYEQEKCFKGFCPNVFSRMMFGKHVEVKFEEVSKLVNTFTSDEGVLVDAPIRSVEIMSVPRVEVDSLTTRTVQKILEHIRDGHVQRIGVWGVGGVGKTTVMKMVNNLPEISQMFTVVIWVTVSEDWSIMKVQNEIAARLKLNLEENMSRKLFEKLKNAKYLLLLDDVWDKVDLKDVGVPAPSSENGCKVLLTTRSRVVCNKMETNVEVPVEVLSDEEAWKLFREKVTDVIELPMIEPLAKRVVRECGGLPLVIIVVGGALRKETNIHVWENALNELRMAATSHIEDMEKVFKRLKYSYDRLKDNMKSCFLYGALYPEDYEIKIDELIEYWIAEGFIEGAGNLEEARSKGHAILKYLVDASLLSAHIDNHNDGWSLSYNFVVFNPGREYVKMHDVIRDLALRITSHGGGEGQIFWTRAGAKLEELSRKEQAEMKPANVISLMHNNLCRLPESVDCPVLTTLFLQGNKQLEAIPDSFFEGMSALRVLDLSDTIIKKLPPSVCRLTNLRGLYLTEDRWHWFTLPPEIGSLKSLEVLAVKGIRYLPIEIGELGRLRHLRVSFSCARDDDTEHEVQRMIPHGGILGRLRHLRVSFFGARDDDTEHEVQRMIPHGGISRLTHLEDLRIWIDMGDERWNEIVEAVTEEIGALKELCRLDFFFASVENLERFINISRPWNRGLLKSFRFTVSRPTEQDRLGLGIRHIYTDLTQLDRWLIFNNCNTILDVPVQVFRRANNFIFRHCTAFEKLGQLGENLSGLKFFSIENCDFGQTLIGGGWKLPNLEDLQIWESSNMLNIWESNSSLTPPLLGNLRKLLVYHCDKLKYVLPRGLLPHVPNLKTIDVSECKDLEQIIEGGFTNNTLQKLTTIKLRWLDKLDCICEGVISWPSLENVDIFACVELRRLPFGTDSAPSLKTIVCKKEWWDSLEWEDDATRNRFQSLTRFQ
ncbi:Disease resistance protein [Acorus calamus]|uniref:Disease resistance protein n=1 Tax=Acorus calamus TaxID=4465 RepID=A0AAV9F1Z9_ACOCL|nr:Disease resistance protein [Acorus calamus]